MRTMELLAVLFLSGAATLLSSDVTSYRYDNNPSGANTNEKSLSLDSVNPLDFGLQHTAAIPGQIYAQPLYQASGVSNLPTAYAATQANVVAAVNVTNGQVFWMTTLTNAGQPVWWQHVCYDTDVAPLVGICGTPVLTNNTLYLLSKAETPGTPNAANASTVTTVSYTIYRINAQNGAVTGWNTFAATTASGYDGTVFQNFSYRTNGTNTDPFVPGTGDGAIKVNGQSRVYFSALRQMNRVALTLSKGILYAGFASHGDLAPYHGWVLGFDPATLKVVAVLNTTPNGSDGGIWQSGGRFATDSAGNLYCETGNGSFSGNLFAAGPWKGLPVDADYGDCFLKITPTTPGPLPNGNGLMIADYFSPSNNTVIDNADLDLGSCGPLLIPSGGKTYLVGCGKDGTLFSMNATNMGKFSPVTNFCVQTLPQAVCQQGNAAAGAWVAFMTPAYANGRIFVTGSTDCAKQFTFTNGIFGGWYLDSNNQVQTAAESTNIFAWPGANGTISGNGTNSQIFWAAETFSHTLRAYRANDLLCIWNSSAIPTDGYTGGIKFAVPVVADGYVLLGTDSKLLIFGPVRRN